MGIILYGLISGNPNDDPTDRWALLRNDGLGNLALFETYPAGADILDLVLEDLDGVSGPEAITAAGDDGRISITYNQQGLFRTPAVVVIDDPRATIGGTTCSDISSGDFNNDSIADLAMIANHSRLLGDGPDTLTLLIGGTLGMSTIPVVTDLLQHAPMRLLGDQIAGGPTNEAGVIFLGDSLYGDPEGVGLFWGTTGGVFNTAHFLPLNGAPADLTTLDVNSDLIKDLAVLRIRDEGLTAGISIVAVENNGIGTYMGSDSGK